MTISFCELQKVLCGSEIQSCNDIICGISIYADYVQKNNVYFCINSSKYSSLDGSLGFTNNEDSVYGFGGNQNGHEEIKKAVERGASAIVIDDLYYFDKNIDVGWILVDDSFQALKRLATHHISINKVKIIAVTGSTGKTTTCQALVDTLSTYFVVKKIHRVRNSVLAMCLEILQNIVSKRECLVIEMQMDGYGQIEHFCEIAEPDISIITGVNFSHYARFKSIDEVLAEKLAVYRKLKKNGFLIYNDDNEVLHEWAMKQSDTRILGVSISKKNRYSISNLSTYGEYNYWSFDMTTRDLKTTEVKMETTGISSVYSALYCSAVADMLKIPLGDFLYNDLRKIKSPIGRFSCFKGINGSEIIIDSYNASFISMKQGIEYVLKSSKSRKVLILGSMLELAEKTESEHRKLGRLINQSKEDFYIISFGEAAMYIVSELENISSERKYCAFTYEDIVEFLDTISIDHNTIVFIKGSGAMRLEIIAPYLLAKRIF